MENSNNLCGCSQEKLASRSTEENLEDCKVCGILVNCPYPKTALLKKAKEATEEQTHQNKKRTKDLQAIARTCLHFDEFHQKACQVDDNDE